MAEPAAARFHNRSSPPTFHDVCFTDTHLETKESRSFRLDRHRGLRSLERRQHRYEQLRYEQLWSPPDPMKDTKGTRGEVWHEARVKQALAVRPVWLRTCHCVDCVRFRYLEKDKEKRVEIARAIRRVERSGGCHLYQANRCDCWDNLCTGCSWDMTRVTEEDGNEAGENHSQGYGPYSDRAIPFETNILDLVKFPRRSWRRARAVSDLISGKGMTSACTRAEGSAVHSETASEEWVSVHEDMLIEGSSVDWDHCSVASL